MNMTFKRAEEIECELEQLMDYCLHCHNDNTVYKVCELLKEIIEALPKIID